MKHEDARSVVMMGTALETRGGIAAAIAAWREGGLFHRWPVEYVETHCEGSWAQKAACAAGALLVFVGLLLRRRGSVLHAHCASRASFWRKSVFMSAAHLARWPVILHLHGGRFPAFYEEECGPAAKRAVRFFLEKAAFVVVLSERWARWVRSVAPRAQVRCVPNPVETPSAVPLVRDTALVSFVGRVRAMKGIDELLRAIAIVAREVPAVRLTIAGDGDLEGVRRRAARLGIGRRVRLLGWIDPSRRDDLLARSAAFVLPSHAEGMPLSLLQAMATGCPSIATAVGGIPDLIDDGVNGLLVRPGDAEDLANALTRLLTDRELARRLGANARKTAIGGYATRRSLEEIGRLYAELGVGHGRARARPAPPRLQESA